jgi:CRP-like cAMP-binding protein
MTCLPTVPEDTPNAARLFAAAQSAATEELKREIIHRARRVTLPESGILLREGDQPDSLYLLIKGEVIFSIHSADRIIPCFMVESSSLIGLSAIIARAPLALTATASPGAEILQMDASRFLELIESRTEWYMSALCALAQETVKAHQALAEMLAS